MNDKYTSIDWAGEREGEGEEGKGWNTQMKHIHTERDKKKHILFETHNWTVK